MEDRRIEVDAMMENFGGQERKDEAAEVERKVRERLIILQQLQSESESLQRKIIELELIETELDKTIESLEYFNSLDTKVEALMNLGGGVFAYVDVKDSKKMLVDVGAGVIVEKEVGDAIETLKKKRDRIEDNIKKLGDMLQQITTQAERIQMEIAQLTKKE